MGVIAVHGGAGSWRGADPEAVVRTLKSALAAGLSALERGDCVDAIVEAIATMEDSGILNAGTGSVLDYVGNISMDAGLMRSDGRAGAVAMVSYPKNPIRLARIVMERTPHVILAGPAADELARRLRLEPHAGPTERARERWKSLRASPESSWVSARVEAARALGYDTVGAVAASEGCLAAGASTGGVALKLPGRIGDSPIPGAGFFANSEVAISATGIGETIILSMSSLRAAELYASIRDIKLALERVVGDHTARWGAGTLGLIAVTRGGDVAAAHNAEGMPWGYARGGELRVFEPRL